jgi:peptidyl-prolyl cis-trans isomerase A (cyclophilin A)
MMTMIFWCVVVCWSDPPYADSAKFDEKPAAIQAKPRVVLETAAGVIVVELESEKAPKTTANFLRYVEKRLYDGGHFHRSVTQANQPMNPVKIEVIQAAANPSRQGDFFREIPLERTRDTGLKHVAGAISMARDGPDSARDEFFICVTDQPELDFGGRRNPDGQGFAVFGKVVQGMDIVRKIHQSPVREQTLEPKIAIQSARRQTPKS